ncbi:MAG: toll/interleukin-1 receptor domain-containing protein [Leptolyngbya sp. SIO1E4]|nr:toll/interleukin-1 receptor domain-containing protein [Leptolyngbya sp. SIO1E4]
MTKLFVSYALHDSKVVDAIVAELQAAGQGFDIWFDKDSIPPGGNWWHAILAGIRDCEVFLFMLSERSAQSEYCGLEVQYAADINRPIFPLMLPGAWITANKPDLAFDSTLLPKGLDSDIQRVPHQGTANLLSALSTAIETYDPNVYKDLSESVPLPLRPHETHPIEMYTRVKAALFDTRPPDVPTAKSALYTLLKNHAEFRDVAHAWLELLDRYNKLTLLAQCNMKDKLCQRFSEYKASYTSKLSDFLGFYDPYEYDSRFG